MPATARRHLVGHIYVTGARIEDPLALAPGPLGQVSRLVVSFPEDSSRLGQAFARRAAHVAFPLARGEAAGGDRGLEGPHRTQLLAAGPGRAGARLVSRRRLSRS